MQEYLENPRRAPRALARCPTVVLTAGGRFAAETADVGPRGCQIVSPRPVRRGEAVHVEISDERVPEKLRLNAHVAWTSRSAPWRLGLAFAPVGEHAARWFDGLLSAHPRLGGYRLLPERIPMDAVVHLGAPPREIIDLGREQLDLLRAVASGARIDELRARLRQGWPGAQRALFSLLAARHVTLDRRAAVEPSQWARILDEEGRRLAARPLAAPAAAPAPSPPGALAAAGRAPLPPARDARSPLPAGPAPAPAPPRAAPISRAEARGIDEGLRSPLGGGRVPKPDFVGAGVGWRSPPKARSPQADQHFRLALSELEAGRHASALVLLRRAMALAPGDPEIAQRLGDAAFRRV
jgi:PilZ domain-containing protein